MQLLKTLFWPLTLLLTNCIISLHLQKLPADGISWMQNCLTQKSLLSVSVENWQVLILRMPGFLLWNETTGIFFHSFAAEVVLTEQDALWCRQQNCYDKKWFPYSQFQSVPITSSIAFLLQSVNLGVHDIVKHFVVMVLIMENVLPKKKLITDIKYML